MLLRERDAVAARGPCHARRHVEIDVDAVAIVEVRTDAVVGGDLRKRARAAVPLVGVIDLRAVVVVVGVVEAVAVFLDRLGAEDAVVENALHAVAVAAVAGDADQIARDFEVGIGAAGSFEAGMGLGQALADFAAAGLAEILVRAPSRRWRSSAWCAGSRSRCCAARRCFSLPSTR